MSTRPTRKRRRSQAFPEEEDAADPGAGEGEGTKDRLDKEREVWDAFKDEHVEVFDLSLILWRRYDLVRELDQQDTRNTASLLEAFMKYVQFRRACAQPIPAVVPPATEPEDSNVTLDIPTVESETLKNSATESDTLQDSALEQEALEDPTPSRQDSPPVPTSDATVPDQSMPPANANGATSSQNIPPASLSQPTPMPGEQVSSRELLATIAKLSEASIRDRQEKVTLTHSVCESVDRSIRLIDQAIQEQEHLISLGARSGTHLAPILLPELTVPRWTKPARVTVSPDLDNSYAGNQSMVAAPTQRRRKGKRGRKKDPSPTEDVVPLPRPNPPVIPNPDPNESRYCYCDQVSFGEMIACDDPRCQREWFHLSCTNLAAAPEGRKKWFCDDCVLRKKKKK
ncbi:PHD-type domain-containing protein [Mycena sanguinolenta]|uniref:PHD-type domain-containing protein n=1 Tax=Mycena sanguinolenta TaxID=230812 RepID=A0A8H7D5B3_9AGAR|nr:PHD-type domain-containing protein [Mycena sanguinolenta]